jgi:hypothetical protein
VKDYIPAKFRRPIYGVFAFIGLGLGATQVGFAAAQIGQPQWMTIALAVYPFVAAGVGFTAQANTPTADEPKHAA